MNEDHNVILGRRLMCTQEHSAKEHKTQLTIFHPNFER